MAIWGIADLHASRVDPGTGLPVKPMDVFGSHWRDHMDQVERNWRRSVVPGDTVIIAGDLDWGMHIEETQDTLRRIDGWPGRKVLVRGNHDYWWPSRSTNRVRRSLPSSISLIHNDALVVEGYAITGAKGAPVPGSSDWSEENAKLLNREAGRLQTSLQAAPTGLPIIVALHYPPFYPGGTETPFRALIDRHDVRMCIYGHLHGASGNTGPAGIIGRAEYRCVAADHVGFEPVLLVGEAERRDREKEAKRMADSDRESLRDLAEDEMADKRKEFDNEAQVRELYDVPNETAGALARQQEKETGRSV